MGAQKPLPLNQQRVNQFYRIYNTSSNVMICMQQIFGDAILGFGELKCTPLVWDVSFKLCLMTCNIILFVMAFVICR